jgi:1-acyl-sn-glycerol-3-phosphate acyltransferase
MSYPLLWYYKRDAVKYYSQLAGLRRWIAVRSAFLAGFRFKIKTETQIDWSKNYIICANHSSNLDITALMLSCKLDFSFMGKEELLKNPVTKTFFKTIDIPVNRSSKFSSFRAFKRAQNLLESGKSIALFPEGGIDDHFPPQLNSFKIGAFKLAVDSHVPILPIVIHDAWEHFWDDGLQYGTAPGVCHVTILQPILPEHFFNPEDLRDEIYNAFQSIWTPQVVTI